MRLDYRQAVLALILATGAAHGQEPEPQKPTAQMQAYLDAVERAEAITDPRERCLAYPALPGNDWLPGTAEALCALMAEEISLDEIEKTLDGEDGGKVLDERYAALLASQFQPPAHRDRIFRAYDVFDHGERAGRLAQRWVEQSPKSTYARTARAWHLVDAGWEARGKARMKDTSAQRVQRMNELFAQAIPDLDFAMKKNPRLLPACDRLIAIGASSSDLAQRVGMQACLKADAASYRVMSSLLWAEQPRWGGSLEGMRHLVAMARAREQDNPALGALRGNEMGQEASQHPERAEMAPVLEQTARLSPSYLDATARAVKNLGRYWDSVMYASQAIRFNPRSNMAYQDRARSLEMLNHLDRALPDARRAEELAPKDGWGAYELGSVLRRLKRFEEARAAFKRAMDDTDTRESANEMICESYWLEQNVAAQAACAKEMLAEFPRNGEAWRLLALALKDLGDPGAHDAAERFLAFADPANWTNHAYFVDYIKGWLASKPKPKAATQAAPANGAK
ncbi:tetratricopeptide repeat protein [Agrilutibacter solisilvae]|uniref:DUF4034 domain-containing protein n=1 Tax=Agrilutibacter solisilvae TaxID=2763317 RepID=A0A974XY08_9GAMM|nr:hypothetical protein [Lysobacter solisilvae]QSX77867.1 hypothetical protein I8J32_014230 [Lysobacter solisilvae]